jgi:hypothetical protein
MNQPSLKAENLRLKRELAELRRQAAENYKINSDPVTPVSTATPDHADSASNGHQDLTEHNTAALLPKKQNATPAEIAEEKAAKADPVFAAWMKAKLKKEKRRLGLN